MLSENDIFDMMLAGHVECPKCNGPKELEYDLNKQGLQCFTCNAFFDGPVENFMPKYKLGPSTPLAQAVDLLYLAETLTSVPKYKIRIMNINKHLANLVEDIVNNDD